MKYSEIYESKYSALDLYRVFLIVFFLCLVAVYVTESYVPLLFPFCLLAAGLIMDDYRRIFYVLFALLPFSMEYYFENLGLGMDIPSEPVMLVLTVVTVLLVIRDKMTFPKNYIFHPVFLLLFIHVFWIFVTSVNSTFPWLSFKFLLAKLWYIIPFCVFPLYAFKEEKYFVKAYKIVYYFLLISIVIVLVRHSFEGFTFAASYDVVRPFFRNHVTYAAISVVCLPFVWSFMKINQKESTPYRAYIWAFFIFVTGIYFSFTRAAILSMFIALGAYYIFHARLVKPVLAMISVILIAGVTYLSWDNKYMDFAPDFERTITHTEFDNLLEATYKLEDISSMERVYRWMAGAEMIKEKFWMGFGPSTFYSNYKSYSISSFQTYVSDNPEKSGIHNYFLMIWVEQGFTGLLIWMILCFTVLIWGENIYHKASIPRDRYFIMATLLSTVIILSMNLINDLIETDKVGPFFFFNVAILLFYSQKYPDSRVV